jgi:uncharacterized membrane protein YccC
MTRGKLRRALSRQWPNIATASRGTLAALAALAAAEFLKLENPYWAPMTALIVIQPTRGLLLEKSFYRLLGSALGSAAGFVLLLYTGNPLVLTIALSLWIAALVGLGNLLSGLRSYALMMAGCTCVIISMSGYLNPTHLQDIAFGRVACIMVGIIVATGVTALFTPDQSEFELVRRLGRVSGETIAWLALLLRQQGRAGHLATGEREVLIEIAGIESLLESAAAGSLSFKKKARRTRSLLASLLSLLAVGRLACEELSLHDGLDLHHRYWRDMLARHLEEVGEKLESRASEESLAAMAALAAEAKAHLPLLGDTLAEIVASLRLVLSDLGALNDAPRQGPANRLTGHRDWREARRAALRAALAIGAVGATWAATGWAQGPLMLMAMSIMISIFSTKEHPAAFVGNVFAGAAVGTVVALLVRIVLLQGVSNPYLAGAIVAPFLLAGVFAMTQRRLAVGATDATLFFLFTTQPGVPIAIAPWDLALGALAMLMGVGSAWIAYRYLVPISPALRLNSLLAAIGRDLEALAGTGSLAAVDRLRTRLQHRVIRMVAMATSCGADHLKTVEEGVTALAIARSMQRLREQLDGGKLPAESARMVRETLAALSDSSRRPGSAAQALEHAARILYLVLDPGSGAPVPVSG